MVRRIRIRPGSIHTPEDLAQQLTVQVADKDQRLLRRADPNTTLAAWLRGVVGKLSARDWTRQRLRPLSKPEQVVDVAPCPEAHAEQADELRALDAACATLPPECELVVRLQRLGVRRQEALELVQGWDGSVSRRTLQRRLRRARQHLNDHRTKAISSAQKKKSKKFGFFVSRKASETD